MAEEVKDLTGHLLNEIGRIHTSNERIFDKLAEQGETLVRNTVSLEEHVRRTNLLENKMTYVEDEVSELCLHVAKINTLVSIFKPTKEKLKIAALLCALAGGSVGTYHLSSDDSFLKTQVKQFIEKVLE
jgi:hypothetical protein